MFYSPCRAQATSRSQSRGRGTLKDILSLRPRQTKNFDSLLVASFGWPHLPILTMWILKKWEKCHPITTGVVCSGVNAALHLVKPGYAFERTPERGAMGEVDATSHEPRNVRRLDSLQRGLEIILHGLHRSDKATSDCLIVPLRLVRSCSSLRSRED